eukprot:14302304-Alexandrium_andersonii.AAC.1
MASAALVHISRPAPTVYQHTYNNTASASCSSSVPSNCDRCPPAVYWSPPRGLPSPPCPPPPTCASGARAGGA